MPDSVVPKGRGVEGPSGLELWPRYPVLGARSRLGGDVTRGGRGFRVSTELLRLAEDSPARLPVDSARVTGTAWAAAAMWRRGGGHDDGRGPFLPRRRGAFGLGLRVEGARWHDPARSRRPTGRAFTAGLAWRPRVFMLVMGSVVHERAHPGPDASRPRTTAFVRLQLEAPGKDQAP